MAFTIKIYEKDEYIYSLLKKRLISFYPDAYIVNPYIDPEDYSDKFSTYTRVVYDPSDINLPDTLTTTSSPIRLTEDSGIIDCAKLIPLLGSEEGPTANEVPVSGSVYAVLPFVYSDVRDSFIRDLSKRLSGSDFNIRLDFTSKLRALWRSSSGNNMTSLLEACKSRKFLPEDILKYCNMDDKGFLTPGSTTGFDDVYDLGTERSKTLMNHAANFAHMQTRLVNVLAVLEGFKTKDLPELLSCCDKVFILLPASNIGEDLGSKDLISILTQALGRERISVQYIGDTEPSDKIDDRLSQRRLVV